MEMAAGPRKNKHGGCGGAWIRRERAAAIGRAAEMASQTAPVAGRAEKSSHVLFKAHSEACDKALQSHQQS